MADRAGTSLTVGVTTRNRHVSMRRCLESLDKLGDVVSDIIVVDDTSDVPAEQELAGLPPAILAKTRVVRQNASEGNIAGRNTIMRLAATEQVLLLDDDAFVIEAEGIREALGIMQAHPEIAAIACAQAEADGRPWPRAMQPAPVDYRSRITAFIGFAHLLRRRAFWEVGGYREDLHFYGEEKVLCAALLRAGHQVVYLPDVRVAHVPDPSGRDVARYLRYVVRNDCLFALYCLPWPVLGVTLPLRLARYFRMKRGSKVSDPGGFLWIVAGLVRALPTALTTRRAMTWANLSLWRAMARQPPRWQPRTAVPVACATPLLVEGNPQVAAIKP